MLMMIVVTGIIYTITLSASAHPCGWGVCANAACRYVVPSGTLLCFLLLGPRLRLTCIQIPTMLVIPIIWTVCTLLHGVLRINAPGDVCVHKLLQVGISSIRAPSSTSTSTAPAHC